jgi:hypothetical protein
MKGLVENSNYLLSAKDGVSFMISNEINSSSMFWLETQKLCRKHYVQNIVDPKNLLGALNPSPMLHQS